MEFTNEDLKKMLSLKDNRYEFLGFEQRKIKENNCLIFNAKLSYIPNRCYKCGNTNKEKLVKNGCANVEIQLNSVSTKKTYLHLKKQKIWCKKCGKNFLVNSHDHKKHCTISYQLFNKIGYELSNTVSSMKQISEQNFVSPITTNRKLFTLRKDIVVRKNYLPKILCIDEFRGVYVEFRKLNCAIACWETGKVINVLPTRDKKELDNFFGSFDREARDNVKYFVTDMFQGFIRIGKKYFKNAEIIIDRFHSLRSIKNAVNNSRIRIMKKFNVNSFEYKLLKKSRYNKLLLMHHAEIDTNYFKSAYNNIFHSKQDIVNYILSLSSELENDYYLYQQFLDAFEKRNPDIFLDLINNQDLSEASSEMKSTVSTFIELQKYIVNSIIYPYSNGVLEGINNKIKVVKRNGFGYRNFINLRTRILLVFNLIKKKIERKRLNYTDDFV